MLTAALRRNRPVGASELEGRRRIAGKRRGAVEGDREAADLRPLGRPVVDLHPTTGLPTRT